MQEVQAICDRVLIINQGKKVAYDTVEQLQRRISGDTVIRVEFAEDIAPEKLEAIPGVKAVHAQEDRRWQVVASGEVDIRPSIFRLAVQEDVVLLEMQQEVLRIPFYQLHTAFHDLPRERTYVLYCDRGVISRLHAGHLLESGYDNIKVYRPN